MTTNKTFYITTAIDYVNGSPHIGHAFEKVHADALARYFRLQEYRVFFATGTDEHGAKVVRSAEEQRISVQEFVDSNAQMFKNMDQQLDISYDAFIRTSDKQKHWGNAEKMWNALARSNDLYKKTYKGLYCVGHEAFVTQKDLKDGVCEIHNKAPEEIEEENYFFKLSRYTEPIQQAISSGEMSIIPKERENEVMSFLNEGLIDIPFSRPRKDLQWGIPVPGDSDHTMYVWADALTNYLSVLDWEQESELFSAFWSADIHVIGKDILRFHALIWPAMLLSAGLSLPKRLLVHGFLSVDGAKMSKSVGNVVDPFEVVAEYGADAVRYYLLSEVPFTKDGDFSKEKLKARYNGDLAFGLGNFISRITTLGAKHIQGTVHSYPSQETQDAISSNFEQYTNAMQNFHTNEAISFIQALMQFGDKKINSTELWKMPEKDNATFVQEMSDLSHVATTVAWMLLPIIPNTAQTILNRFGIGDISQKKHWEFCFQRGEPLFVHKD